MNLNGQQVTVLGAGIGGLAVATILAQRGAQVRVIEQAAALREVGAGIQISANGKRVLDAMGLQEATEAAGVRGEAVELLDSITGDLALRMPPPAAGPTWFLHRADLLAVLHRGAMAAGVKLVLGQKVQSLQLDSDRVELTVAGKNVHYQGVLIAADGVRGVARQVVNGPSKPRLSGQLAWRAIVPWTEEPGDRVAQAAIGPGQHIVTYPLRGGSSLNLVAIEERRDWTVDGWSQTGVADELRRRFSNFGARAGRALRSVEDVHIWALHQHPVASRWHRGPAVLLGDSAHSTLPFLAQGACMALEDAWVLADALEASDNVTSAFTRYQDLRLSRTRRIVRASWLNRWRFHAPSPFREIGFWGLRLGGGRFVPDLRWLYKYDATRAVHR